MQESTVAPGEYVLEELRNRGWTQDDLARILDRPLGRVNEIIHGKQSLSPEIAIALQLALGTPARVWLQREADYRLSLATDTSDGVKRRSELYGLGPVKEMQKRGWLKSAESLDELEQNVLKFYQIESLAEEPAIHGAMRKTNPTSPLTPAQRAWAFRVRQLARSIPNSSLAAYDDAKMSDCNEALRKLASYSGGVRKAPKILMSFGIRFVIVEGLTGAKVDGFATWLDENSPVIGMSLKHDRLDNFWFVLGHEWSHIKHRDLPPIDADVAEDSLDGKPPMERRADNESASMLVPQQQLRSFINRVGPFYSAEKINQFANLIKVHPSIIIGQLKHCEEIPPSHHNRSVVHIREEVIKSALTDGWGKSINIGASS